MPGDAGRSAPSRGVSERRAEHALDVARAPGRRDEAGRRASPSKPTTVDSSPIPVGPASRMTATCVAEIGGDMGGRGRADMAGAIGARRGERRAGRREQRLRDRMGGDADRDRIEAGGGEVG